VKILLDIKDDKALFFLELLRNFPFVKAKSLSPANAQFLYELQSSVEEVNLAREGKIHLKSAEDLLNEL
jgi:hypothetical protein